MRLPKEIAILLILLIVAMASVLGYVIVRRSRWHRAPPVAVQPAGTATPKKPAVGEASPVDLTKHDGETVDFSSGRPVIKQSAADKAALDAGLKDIADATKDVTFGPPPKPAARKTAASSSTSTACGNCSGSRSPPRRRRCGRSSGRRRAAGSRRDPD